MSRRYLSEPRLGGYRFFPDPNVRWLGDVVRRWDGEERVWLAILGVPFDGGTVSHRRGSRYAPSRIREYLYSKTNYLVEHDSEIVEGVYDCGDVEVNIVDSSETMRRLAEVADEVFKSAENVLTFGGDHSLTYELIKAARRVSGGEMGLIQFDAHHDTRTEWGQHSGFWLRRLLDENVLKGVNVVQIGIRGSLYSRHYIEHVKNTGIRYVTVWDLRTKGLEQTTREIVRWMGGIESIYITFDIDALDQAYAPGTDHPSPGGMSSWEAIYMIYSFASSLNARWLDIMEVSPPNDQQDQTTKLAAELANQYIHARHKHKSLRTEHGVV